MGTREHIGQSAALNFEQRIPRVPTEGCASIVSTATTYCQRVGPRRRQRWWHRRYHGCICMRFWVRDGFVIIAIRSHRQPNTFSEMGRRDKPRAPSHQSWNQTARYSKRRRMRRGRRRIQPVAPNDHRLTNASLAYYNIYCT